MALTDLPLLPVDSGDLRDEVWRLEFDDSGPPVLMVSRHLVPDWRSLPATREFVTLALPEIFRSILKQIVLVEQYTDLEDTADWRTQWLRFASRLPGVTGRPPLPDEGDAEQWIDDTVAAFCRQVRVADVWRRDAAAPTPPRRSRQRDYTTLAEFFPAS